jgi:hypothetical protein
MELLSRQLEAIVYYDSRYDIVIDYPLVADHPLLLNDHAEGKQRLCRFCHRAVPEVTFNNDAHAIPEFLGNKSLISMNECDSCNALLADRYEDHLAKWFGPLRTVSQIHGKSGVPTYQDKKRDHGGRIRIERGDNGLHFTLVSADPMAQLSNGGPMNFSLPVDTPSQPYIPIRAAMALVKAACSVCPLSELNQCDMAMDWVMERMYARVLKFPVLHAFTPGPNPYGVGKIMLLRRRVDEPIPYLWCIIATANYRFQFFVPFCGNDGWLKYGAESTFETRHFPIPFDNGWVYGQTKYSMFDWSGEEPVVDRPRVTLHVDRAELVKGSEQT